MCVLLLFTSNSLLELLDVFLLLFTSAIFRRRFHAIKEAIKIVINWFNKTFKAENQSNFPEVPPKEMKHPFTGEEVNRAISY